MICTHTLSMLHNSKITILLKIFAHCTSRMSENSESGNEETCSICLETLTIEPLADKNEIIELQCQHCFHTTCLQQWLKGTCPLCRDVYQHEQVSTRSHTSSRRSTNRLIMRRNRVYFGRTDIEPYCCCCCLNGCVSKLIGIFIGLLFFSFVFFVIIYASSQYEMYYKSCFVYYKSACRKHVDCHWNGTLQECQNM